MGNEWSFVKWLLDNSNGAVVNVDSDPSLLVNFLIPLLPWLMVLGFVWFFILRPLRKHKPNA